MLTVEQYADSDVNERRIADYEVKLGKNALLGDINESLKDYNPGGGDYDVPYFDGGRYGAIAYLDSNNEIAYYYGTTSNDIAYTPNSSTGLCVNNSKIAIHSDRVLAFSLGDSASYSSPNSSVNEFLPYFYNLRRLYNFDDDHWKAIGVTISFLSGCVNFNSPLYFPTSFIQYGASITRSIMRGCINFNSPIVLSPDTTLLCTFLNGCRSFNQPITIPNNTVIMGSFLYDCESFNQPLTIPEGVTFNGSTGEGSTYAFMGNCYNYKSIITINTPSIPTYNETSISGRGNLSMNAVAAPAYDDGITITGPGAQAWKDALPDRSSSPYRKLIVAE